MIEKNESEESQNIFKCDECHREYDSHKGFIFWDEDIEAHLFPPNLDTIATFSLLLRQIQFSK